MMRRKASSLQKGLESGLPFGPIWPFWNFFCQKSNKFASLPIFFEIFYFASFYLCEDFVYLYQLMTSFGNPGKNSKCSLILMPRQWRRKGMGEHQWQDVTICQKLPQCLCVAESKCEKRWKVTFLHFAEKSLYIGSTFKILFLMKYSWFLFLINLVTVHDS